MHSHNTYFLAKFFMKLAYAFPLNPEEYAVLAMANEPYLVGEVRLLFLLLRL